MKFPRWNLLTTTLKNLLSLSVHIGILVFVNTTRIYSALYGHFFLTFVRRFYIFDRFFWPVMTGFEFKLQFMLPVKSGLTWLAIMLTTCQIGQGQTGATWGDEDVNTDETGRYGRHVGLAYNDCQSKRVSCAIWSSQVEELVYCVLQSYTEEFAFAFYVLCTVQLISTIYHFISNG